MKSVTTAEPSGDGPDGKTVVGGSMSTGPEAPGRGRSAIPERATGNDPHTLRSPPWPDRPARSRRTLSTPLAECRHLAAALTAAARPCTGTRGLAVRGPPFETQLTHWLTDERPARDRELRSSYDAVAARCRSSTTAAVLLERSGRRLPPGRREVQGESIAREMWRRGDRRRRRKWSADDQVAGRVGRRVVGSVLKRPGWMRGKRFHGRRRVHDVEGAAAYGGTHLGCWG